MVTKHWSVNREECVVVFTKSRQGMSSLKVCRSIRSIGETGNTSGKCTHLLTCQHSGHTNKTYV